VSQIEVSKLPAYVVLGTSDELNVSKLVVYVLLEPSDAPDGSNRQGHVHTQIIRRR
jgi:hypothetical protein